MQGIVSTAYPAGYDSGYYFLLLAQDQQPAAVEELPEEHHDWSASQRACSAPYTLHHACQQR